MKTVLDAQEKTQRVLWRRCCAGAIGADALWLLLACLSIVIGFFCLFVLDRIGIGFFFALAGAVSIGVSESMEPMEVGKRKAVELHAALERQIQDWNTIIKEINGLRKELAADGGVSRRNGHLRLLDECNLLLQDAQLELRDARSRLKEHRDAFNTAYWIYQDLDQRGRPNYKYVVHRGPCVSCNNGRRRSFLGMKKWDGPYDEWEHAQGIGTRRFCLTCCRDLHPLVQKMARMR